MKLLALTVTAACALSATAHAADPQALLRKYDCTLCHAIDEAKAGPAFVDIAAKYKHNSKAVPTLVALITQGAHGEGIWPMPPSPQVPAADARTMARYILALKK